MVTPIDSAEDGIELFYGIAGLQNSHRDLEIIDGIDGNGFQESANGSLNEKPLHLGGSPK